MSIGIMYTIVVIDERIITLLYGEQTDKKIPCTESSKQS